ncbi:MAG: excinuclease ABC subunit UvrA [Verrucomicrobiota bacterium]|nr:excinuclease ABC subunit UvrA [Verrucomicrobiota bacterium]MDG1889823.1 excinuclease ABC subunit UvrA [Verrucomicrobiota bacterium]
MPDNQAENCIQLRGVRHNNLKGFDLDIPLGKLVVVTGLSGSGKSSLAFDTLYAEGQRRYIETFTPYARQFFDRMDKPMVDRIDGIPPAIAIEQRNTVKTTRSTIGTMTEICEYAKLLWAQKAMLYCAGCGALVREEDPGRVWKHWRATAPGETILITFDVPLSSKLDLSASVDLVKQQGFTRLLIGSEPTRLEESLESLESMRPECLTIIQDRIKVNASMRARFVEACEQAYQFGKGHLAVRWLTPSQPQKSFRHSRHRHCPHCDLDFPEPSSSLFSFNNPVGACPTCKGFGRIITLDPKAAIPDPSLSLAGGAVRPWQTGNGQECQRDLLQFCRKRNVPTKVPFGDLEEHHWKWVLEGDPGYGNDAEHQWPNAWYGVRGYFRWLESKSYKMHVRVLLARYRTYQMCHACHGARLQAEALNYRMSQPGDEAASLTLPAFYKLPIGDALARVNQWRCAFRTKSTDPLGLVLDEIHSRLNFLVEVGLDYLTLDRPTRSLSGGETERVNLTSCLGSRLVNALYVLDEPSVGLHPRDTDRLIGILQQLRDQQNTVVVVEHEAKIIEAADQIVDIGPGHGSSGGSLVFQGDLSELRDSRHSLTGAYLSGKRRIQAFRGRAVRPKRHVQWLKLKNATKHNLKHVTVEIPLKRLVCITGVSGSGKTTLVRDVLIPLLKDTLNQDLALEKTFEDVDHVNPPKPKDNSKKTILVGFESIDETVLVDQSSIGRTPRSNPAVYVGAFDAIRDLFAGVPSAKEKGFKSGNFSFNARSGQCEHCRGVGYEKIEMQFLSDVYIRCPECDGTRYQARVLEVKLSATLADDEGSSRCEWSIADMLEATVDEALSFIDALPLTRSVEKAVQGLQWLQKAGLGYLKLGQPVNTLSGGESQRLKLVRHLTQISNMRSGPKHCLYVFDEPTTGLHFEDVKVLLELFQELVDEGHSVLMVEHHVDVIRSADWIIDLGPEGGEGGGRLVVCGPPGLVQEHAGSHTGAALRESALPG